jgi:hypothetical protein
VYRISDNGTAPKRIAHKLRETTFHYVPALPSLLYAQYAVTAVDAYGNESELIPINLPKNADSDPLSAEEKVKKAYEDLWGKK